MQKKKIQNKNTAIAVLPFTCILHHRTEINFMGGGNFLIHSINTDFSFSQYTSFLFDIHLLIKMKPYQFEL